MKAARYFAGHLSVSPFVCHFHMSISRTTESAAIRLCCFLLLLLFLQVGPDNLRRNALAGLLVQLAKRDAFNTLRTQQQLGYIVHMYGSADLGVQVGAHGGLGSSGSSCSGELGAQQAQPDQLMPPHQMHWQCLAAALPQIGKD